MVKIKLLRLFRWTQRINETEPNGWPVRGLWMTESVNNLGDKHQYHEMVCVMPDGCMYEYGHKLKVYTTIIEELMTEMEIVERK